MSTTTVTTTGQTASPGQIDARGPRFGAAVTCVVLALALVGLAITGFGSVLAAISTNTLLQTGAPDHLRGRVMGFYSFVVLGLAPFGSLQAGWISEHFGVPASFVVGAVVCSLVALGLAWDRDRPRASGAQV